MKRLLILYLTILCLCTAQAQTVTIGSLENAVSYQTLPINTNYDYSYTQQIYLQSDINEQGTITKIKFYLCTTTALTGSDFWTIYMGHTTKTGFAGSTNSDYIPFLDLTQVYSGTINTGSSYTGWYEITLSTPFIYNNTDNLVVAVYEDAAGKCGLQPLSYTITTTTNQALQKRGSSVIDLTAPGLGSLIKKYSILQLGFDNNTGPLPADWAQHLYPADGAAMVSLFETFDWDPGNVPPDGYRIYFGTNNPPTNIENGKDLETDTTYTPLGELSPNTTYYWKIVPYTSAGYSATCPVYSFTTEAPVSTLPLTENFDNTTIPDLPDGWKKFIKIIPNDANRQASISTTTATSNSGTKCLEMYSGYQSQNGAFITPIFVSPELAMDIKTVKLTFFAKSSLSSNQFVVGTMNNPKDTFTPYQYFGNNYDFTQQTVDFSNYTGTDSYIAIKFLPCFFNTTLYIDDISIEEAPASTVWTGSADNNWATITNWSNGVPQAISNVLIPSDLANYPTLTSSVTVKTLKMMDGATLLGFENLTVTDGVTLKRDIVANEHFHLVSSPVQSAIAGNIFTSTTLQAGNVFVRKYDEPSGNWMNLQNTDALISGSGYSLIMDAVAGVETFSGQFNTTVNGFFACEVTNQGVVTGYNGFNLIGNPFPANIDWNLVTDKNEMESSIWTWDVTGGSYISWNGSLGSLTDGIIPIGQGFFVKTTDNATNPYVNLPLTALCHGDRSLYKSQVTDVLRLDITNNVNTYRNSLFINYTPEATAGFDVKLDTRKFDDLAETPEIWAMAGDTRVTVDALPSIEKCSEIDVWFKPGVDGNYTINASGLETFANNVNPLLVDNVTGIIQNLKINPVYTFDALSGTPSDRFSVKFSTVGIAEEKLSNVKAYSLNKYIIVELNSIWQGTVNITDLSGKTVFKKEFSNETSIISNKFNPGLYLVTVTYNTNTSTKKVLVK